MKKLKKLKFSIGALAIVAVLGLNVNHALNGYGVTILSAQGLFSGVTRNMSFYWGSGSKSRSGSNSSSGKNKTEQKCDKYSQEFDKFCSRTKWTSYDVNGRVVASGYFGTGFVKPSIGGNVSEVVESKESYTIKALKIECVPASNGQYILNEDCVPYESSCGV